MGNKPRNPKKSSDSGSYSQKPHHIFRPNFAQKIPSPASVLSHKAAHLFDNLIAQYNGKNNGDLSVAPKIMELFGWKSRGSINDALVELLAYGFIEQTRQGGRNKCSLYALTFKPIDDCNGKLDVPATNVASNLWKPENAHKRDIRWVNKWEQRKVKTK